MKIFKSTLSRIEIIDRAEIYIFCGFIFGLLTGFSIALFLI